MPSMECKVTTHPWRPSGQRQCNSG